MAKHGSATAVAGPNPDSKLRGGIFRLRRFFEDVRVEMSKVAWPSWEELKTQTGVVMLMLGILAVIVAALDMIFRLIVVGILNLF